ncbi:MAG TPA: pyrroloquinoline quinone biosynthesis peptide chaperone PqqD [Polyangia bacterium]|nr:pyrroloquinoline quinone biosynthesis peptide chaperone PqqD [Polyangia bacterium]
MSRPRLASKARLKWDRHANKHMLLYPEHGLILNDSAASIVQLCDGQSTIADIVNALADQSGGAREQVETDVIAFVSTMRERGLMTLGDS